MKNSTIDDNLLVNEDEQILIMKKRNRLCFRMFFGTMSQLNEIYCENQFLSKWKFLRYILIYFDSVFRGIGQVMFANNPLSGLIIFFGLYCGNSQLSFYGFFGTCISTLTGYLFEFDSNLIRNGLFGYNGCLIGMAIPFFTLSNSYYLICPIIIFSIFSTIFYVSINRFFVRYMDISSFTFSFQMCTWIYILSCFKSHHFQLNHDLISPHLLKISDEKVKMTFENYSLQMNFQGFLSGISQVYFIENVYTGMFILIGLCLCSRILAFFALFGSIIGQLFATYVFQMSVESIRSGLWAFNCVLTCQVLGGMFFVLSEYQIWFYTFYGSLMTLLIQLSLSSYFSSIGLPVLTFPFTFISWIFCSINQ
ncbi:unnamed protein product [Adineta ricciae]|uniref:Urea transporter n=1 Tax=Adineta ricciae TaxID=249248 RepID=A0A815AEH8_ADIRI|nr:unnamed protein product [Adineta ricciae]CAF1486814.1 unnamed protein product [Adineta ricciae]